MAALVLATSGCNGASNARAPGDPAAETSCDPLATHPTPLGTILGAAKDPAGTVYLVDEFGLAMQLSVVRVFILMGNSLVRQDVIGSGEIRMTEDIETFQSADGSTAPRDLDIQLDGGKALSMTLGPEGSAKSRLEGIDASAPTPLVLIDPSTVQGLPAIDLPGSVNYVADSPDGHAIVVTSPLDNEVGFGAFHVFYGTPSLMQERPIVSFLQAGSGYPSIGFTVDSQTLVMAISSLPPTDGGLLNQPGPVTLTGGGQSVPFTLRLPTPTTLAGFAFMCLGR